MGGGGEHTLEDVVGAEKVLDGDTVPSACDFVSVVVEVSPFSSRLYVATVESLP